MAFKTRMRWHLWRDWDENDDLTLAYSSDKARLLASIKKTSKPAIIHSMYGGKVDLELVISAVLQCSSLGAVFSFARWKEHCNIFYQFLRVLNSLFLSLRATSPCGGVARILARAARERRGECQGQVISCLTNPWEVYIPQSFRSVVLVFLTCFSMAVETLRDRNPGPAQRKKMKNISHHVVVFPSSISKRLLLSLNYKKTSTYRIFATSSCSQCCFLR